MCRIRILFFTIILFLKLFDNTKQLDVRKATITFKIISNTIKNPLLQQISCIIKKPMIQTLGNTIKNSVKVFSQNKNSMKTLACGFQEKHMRIVHNFGNEPIKYLGEKFIKKVKYTTLQSTSGSKKLSRSACKKDICMRSAAQMIKKEFRSVIKRSTEQINGKELGSLINMVSKSKPYLPLLFVTGGLNRLTQFKLLPSNDSLEDPKDIEKVEQYKEKNKKEFGEILEKEDKYKETRKRYSLKNKDKIAKRMREYYQNNKDKYKQQQKIYHLKNKDRISERTREYYQNNRDKLKGTQKIYILQNKEKITERYRQYRLKNKEEIAQKKKEYRIKNKDKIANKKIEYYLKNKVIIAEKLKKYRLKNKDKIAAERREYYYKNKDKIIKQTNIYRSKNKYKIAEGRREYYYKNKDNILKKVKEYRLKNKDMITAKRKA